MSFLQYAESELDLIGLTAEDEMNRDMRKCILEIVEKFAFQGHSGFSAGYAINILEKLLRYEPISPLTGEESEWTDVGDGLFQNKRCGRVFKQDDEVYDIEGKVFWEWYTYDLEEGDDGFPGTKTIKSYFTNRDSRVPVTFPYVPTIVYEEVVR